MTDESLNILAVGDIVLGMADDAGSYFSLVAPTLKSADIVIGQGEVPFTSRGVRALRDVSSWPCDPKNISALSSAGFSLITLAGNHIWDAGSPGIEDTISGLKSYGIAYVGAGMNIEEARKPVIIERNGTRFGFLSYNCVGPKESWATENEPGCAYVKIITYYELDHPTPGGPPDIYTWAEPASLKAMVHDIQNLRTLCDVLVVVLHKGIGHTRATLATAEQDISYAAIDAGADLILAHHAHLLKGIEQYKGKIIFHGLANFVMGNRKRQTKLTNDPNDWRNRRKKMFPELNKDGSHPDAKYTIIAKCAIENGKITQASYLPCLINEQGQPEILKNDERGQQIFDYMDQITREANLNVGYEWQGNEIVIRKN